MNKTIEFLEDLEEKGFIRTHNNSGYIGKNTYADISNAISVVYPWKALGYKTENGLVAMLDREIPGFSRSKGVSWLSLLAGAPNHKKIGNCCYNDVNESTTEDGKLKRYYAYYSRMVKLVDSKPEEYSISDSWRKLSVFKEFFEKANPVVRAQMKPSGAGLYSAETVSFSGGSNV